jgi:hypothetical protein
MEPGPSSSAVDNLDWQTIPARFQQQAQRLSRQVASLRAELKSTKSRAKVQDILLDQRYNEIQLLKEKLTELQDKLEQHGVDFVRMRVEVPVKKVPNKERSAQTSSQVS